VGDSYDVRREVATTVGIEYFFQARGLGIEVARELSLDYEQRTARLDYAVFTTPAGPRFPPPPPYGEPCGGGFQYLQWVFDKYVPVPLVQELLEIGPDYNCFSEARILEDIQLLREMDLFSQVDYSISEATPGIRVIYEIQGKPLKVDNVSIVRHGLLQSDTKPVSIDLPLKAGGTYTRPDADSAMERLRSSYERGDRRVRILEEVESTVGPSVQVTFHVVGFPHDIVILDGKRIVADMKTITRYQAE
jgi:hypothetical protein